MQRHGLCIWMLLGGAAIAQMSGAAVAQTTDYFFLVEPINRSTPHNFSNAVTTPSTTSFGTTHMIEVVSRKNLELLVDRI